MGEQCYNKCNYRNNNTDVIVFLKCKYNVKTCVHNKCIVLHDYLYVST